MVKLYFKWEIIRFRENVGGSHLVILVTFQSPDFNRYFDVHDINPPPPSVHMQASVQSYRNPGLNLLPVHNKILAFMRKVIICVVKHL